MTPPDTGMILITKRLQGNQPAAFYEYPSLIPWLLTPSRLADSTAAVRADFPVGGSETVFFNTVSEIAGASLSIGDIAISKGFNSAGDGGGGTFYIQSDSLQNYPTDNIISIPVTSGFAILQPEANGYYNIKSMGVFPNNTDQSERLNTISYFAQTKDSISLYFPAGLYSFWKWRIDQTSVKILSDGTWTIPPGTYYTDNSNTLNVPNKYQLLLYDCKSVFIGKLNIDHSLNSPVFIDTTFFGGVVSIWGGGNYSLYESIEVNNMTVSKGFGSGISIGSNTAAAPFQNQLWKSVKIENYINYYSPAAYRIRGYIPIININNVIDYQDRRRAILEVSSIESSQSITQEVASVNLQRVTISNNEMIYGDLFLQNIQDAKIENVRSRKFGYFRTQTSTEGIIVGSLYVGAFDSLRMKRYNNAYSLKIDHAQLREKRSILIDGFSFHDAQSDSAFFYRVVAGAINIEDSGQGIKILNSSLDGGVTFGSQFSTPTDGAIISGNCFYEWGSVRVPPNSLLSNNVFLSEDQSVNSTIVTSSLTTKKRRAIIKDNVFSNRSLYLSPSGWSMDFINNTFNDGTAIEIQNTVYNADSTSINFIANTGGVFSFVGLQAEPLVPDSSSFYFENNKNMELARASIIDSVETSKGRFVNNTYTLTGSSVVNKHREFGLMVKEKNKQYSYLLGRTTIGGSNEISGSYTLSVLGDAVVGSKTATTSQLSILTSSQTPNFGGLSFSYWNGVFVAESYAMGVRSSGNLNIRRLSNTLLEAGANGVAIGNRATVVPFSGFDLRVYNGIRMDEGQIELKQYGVGNKEAADLSKIISPYAAHYATDGTLLEQLRVKEGTGSPVGIVTPDYKGQHYQDNTTPGSEIIYFAVGLTSSNWIRLN